MSRKIEYKKKLKDVSHAIRSEQLVSQYGIGAMIDFPEQTLMVASHEYWNGNIKQVHDMRLEKALGVSYFGMPQKSEKYQDGIAYVRFPKWYFCPSCRRLKPIEEWVKEYQTLSSQKRAENDPFMISKPVCFHCKGQQLVVTRVVTICENGHIDDFPWIAWAHRKNMTGSKEICGNPDLIFKTGNSSSEGLEGLQVECRTCRAKASLADAFNPTVFEDLFSKKGFTEFRCNGLHPWKGEKCSCKAFPKAKQRGASSIYFPQRVTSLIIPMYVAENRKKVEASSTFINTIVPAMDDCDSVKEKEDTLLQKMNKWVSKISGETGLDKESIASVLKDIFIVSSEEESFDVNSIKYKIDEFNALIAPITINNQLSDFYREEMDISKYDIPGIEKIILIKKLREVQALVGFSRLEPVSNSSEEENNERFVSIRTKNTNWFPGSEVYGEGIFLQFNDEIIDRWSDQEEVIKRVVTLNDNKSHATNNMCKVDELDAKFLMLHTLSHILIKQLSFECGYSVSSLKERIYSSSNPNNPMAGILIYTANGDSEGTLGGLVRQGKPDSLTRILKSAVESAKICSNDPVCIMSNGQGRDALNLAACYACGLLPETSCENYNMFLDRGVLVGTLDNPTFGYFSSGSITKEASINKISVDEFATDDDFAPIKVVKQNRGTDLSSMTYEEIWDYISEETDDADEGEFFEALKDVSNAKMEKPIFGETVVFGENRTRVDVDLLWDKSKVMLFLKENETSYAKAKASGWHCICGANRKDIEKLISWIEVE